MKKLLSVFALVLLFAACNNEGEKTDAEKAADSVGAVDKAQKKLNEIIDTAQSKGEKLVDTVTNKVLEPVKREAGKVGEKLKEKLKEAKDEIKK